MNIIKKTTLKLESAIEKRNSNLGPHELKVNLICVRNRNEGRMGRNKSYVLLTFTGSTLINVIGKFIVLSSDKP